jgi:hypothetical protein
VIEARAPSERLVAEDQLIARPVFAAMKQAGALAVAVPLDVSDWLA